MFQDFSWAEDSVTVVRYTEGAMKVQWYEVKRVRQ